MVSPVTAAFTASFILAYCVGTRMVAPDVGWI